MQDLAQHCSSTQLRKTFAIMAVNCEIGHIEEIWLKFKDEMIVDFIQLYSQSQPPHCAEASATNAALLEI